MPQEDLTSGRIKPAIQKRIKVEQFQLALSELEKPPEMRDRALVNSLIGGLKFFVKFPHEIRMQLFDLANLKTFNKGETIFKQGDPSEDFFVIVKGSVCIKVIKDELGNVPVNTRVCYDGDYIGELAHFQESESLTPEIVDRLNRQRVTTLALEQPVYLLTINKLLA